MIQNLKLELYEILNNLILLKWDNNKEDFITLKFMRENCPCANCAGEKDVFGNIYKGAELKLTKKSFIINTIQPIGYYAIRPFWADGHHSGIYSFTLLKNLSKKNKT
tara:strand:+ start:754 stop:1074 length:321 start_codon:yes stop_codon:yes gene_type:complete